MKGFIKTLEASIAVLLMLATVVMLYDMPVSNPEKYLSDAGEYCMDRIYDQGNLRNYVASGSESSMEDELDSCMPGIKYKIKICSSTDCTATGLPNSTVVVVSRLISGNYYESDPKIVSIWMWS